MKPSNTLPIPTELLYQLQTVTLCADVMFMDKLVLLTTYSRRIGFTTVDVLKLQHEDNKYGALKKVIYLYSHRLLATRALFFADTYGLQVLQSHIFKQQGPCHSFGRMTGRFENFDTKQVLQK